MVDRALLKQLQSLNVSQRRQAIIALGALKDRAAIPPLTHVVDTDPDDTLRDLAQKAILYIERHAPAVKPFMMPWDDENAPPAPRDGADEDDDGSPLASILPDYVPPTEEMTAEREAREWAERDIERAWQAYYVDDRQGAEAFLRKAIERSPRIIEIESVREAAGKIMNMNPDRAISALLKPKTLRRGGRPDSLSRRPDRPRTVDEIEDGSAGTLMFDIAMFLLLVFVVNVLTLALVISLLGDSLQSVAANDADMAELAPLIQNLTSGDAGGLFLNALGAAFITLLETLFLWFVIHVVATTITGGNSTFPRLVRKTYPYFALFTPLILGIMLTLLALTSTLDESAALPTAMIIALVIGVFLLAWRIGVAYRFDVAHGCLTMILTVVAFMCCGLTTALVMISADIGPLSALLNAAG